MLVYLAQRNAALKVTRLLLVLVLIPSSALMVLALPNLAYAQSELVVNVNQGNITTANKLSLGFMLDWEWQAYVSDNKPKELARQAMFKLVRVFDHRVSPCTSWDETTRTGTCSWTKVDALVHAILETGAEPMFCMGTSLSNGPVIPSGMSVDPNTDLPYPESFAAYASEWVKHFRAAGLPVRFYEIWNEPWTYVAGWQSGPIDYAKLANYMQLYSVTAGSMRQSNPEVLISFDYIVRKPLLDYWLANGGADVDYIDSHKYDSGSVGELTNAEMIARAESRYFDTSPLGYGISQARQVWANARGKLLPIIISESNFNSAYANGTDPRIQQMVGAVWTALVLRMAALQEVSYYTYYRLSTPASFSMAKPSGGRGFGMINQDDYQPWYPYYVYRMIGSSLAVGDQFVEATSSSADLRTLAWTHNGMLKILLVCTIDEPRTMYLQGATGKASLLKIDNTIPWTTPNEQSQVVDLGAPLTFNGYTVALLTIGSQNGLSISNSGDIAVGIGGSGSNTISVAVAGALPDSIALSCVNGLPSGASCNFNPEFGNTSFSSNLTISTSSSTPVGTFSVKVAGTAGQISDFTSFTLTVNAPTLIVRRR